ncbi:MAG: glycosyltransferase family A protein [Pseudomonadota bacterium]
MLTIAVAVITYGRPQHLAKLAASLERLEGVDRHTLHFVIVDNDEAESARSVADTFTKKDARFLYFCEPKKGIPVARNRGLDEALALGADILCFVDDDEEVDPQWLAQLFAAYDDGAVQMTGGPVLVGPCLPSANRWQRFIHGSLVARSKRKAKKSAKDALQKGKFTIVTNNWLADLEWLRERKLRFDEEGFRYSGGSDTAFFRAFKAVGGKAVWNPKAVVYETVMADRLSLLYQMKRGRAQSANHFRMKRRAISIPLVLSTVGTAALRFVMGGLLLVLPIFGAASPVMAVRSIGWSVGRIDGLLGTRPALYDKPQTN